jgi:hypothetical protein
MKANKLVTALFLLNLMANMATSRVIATEAKGETHKRNGETGMRVNMNTRDDSEVLWSADPKHGWVQTKEKHEPGNHNKTQENTKQKKQKNHAAKH